MRRLLTGYVVKFNRRHRRHGPLFQNRFKSIICQEEVYLKELVRYIHLNPVRAGIVPSVSKLNGYRYCGHSIMMGKRIYDCQDTGYTLGYFGNRESEAKRSYYAYVHAGANLGKRPELAGGGLIRSLGGWEEVKKINRRKGERIKGDERILGDSEFVLQVLEET